MFQHARIVKYRRNAACLLQVYTHDSNACPFLAFSTVHILSNGMLHGWSMFMRRNAAGGMVKHCCMVLNLFRRRQASSNPPDMLRDARKGAYGWRGRCRRATRSQHAAVGSSNVCPPNAPSLSSRRRHCRPCTSFCRPKCVKKQKRVLVERFSCL